MAIQRTGTEFVLKGINRFISGLDRINKEYRRVAQSANKMAAEQVKASARVSKAQRNQLNTSNRLAIERKKLTLSTNQLNRARSSENATVESLLRAEIRYESALLSLTKAQQAVTDSTKEMAEATQSLTDIKAAAAAGASVSGTAVLSGGLLALGGALSIAGNAAQKFLSILGRLGRGIVNLALAPLKKLADFVKGSLQVAFGVILRDSIRVAIDSLGRLWDAAIKITSQFQTLEIRLQNLIAREIRASGAATDVANSFNDAVGPAQELTHWITQLSLRTPFSVTDIANTTAFAMAMGFTSNEAKSLTLSIGNFAAGMGLTSEKMESMIFNFGQMKAAGKVTGTEMRDLARGAFFPLTDVLDEAANLMGVITEDITEFRKAAAEGEVPIEVFFRAFQNVVERDFPDAMERMKGTLQGVMTRFKNFAKTIIGIEVLGPVAKKFAEVVSNALDTLLTPGFQRAARVIGQVLPVAFDRLMASGKVVFNALKNLAAAFGLVDISAMDVGRAIAHVVGFIQKIGQEIAGFINNIADKVSQQMEGMSGGMRQWGFNIISQFAQGMADALTAVVNVLIALGNIITGFLKPGSPPKLLPRLDKWGAEAMTVYMEGWAAADFSVFNGIADKVERFVRSMTENLLDKTKVVPTILDFRDRLAQAMEKIRNGAKLTKGMLEKVFDSFKNASPALKNYAKLMLKMAEADAAVAAAQENLNKVTERYDRILKPLQDRLEQLNNATQDLDDTRRITQLRLILADVNASEGDKERARLEIERLLLQKQIRTVEEEKKTAVDAAEEKLKAAEEAREALQKQLDAAEALVDMQIKTNELIKEQLALLESLKQKLTGKGGGLEIPPFDPTSLKMMEETRGKVSGLLKDIQSDWETIFDEIATSISEDIDTIMSKFGEFEGAIGTLIDVWSGLGDAVKDNRFTQAMDEIKRAADPVADSLDDLKDIFKEITGFDLPSVSINFSNLGTGLLDIGTAFVTGNINAYLSVLNGILQGIFLPAEAFAGAIIKVKDAWVEFVNSAGLADFILNLQNLLIEIGNLTTGLDPLRLAIEGFWGGVKEVTVTANSDVQEELDSMKTDATQKFTDMSDEIVTGGDNSIVPKMLTDINTEFSTKTAENQGTVEAATGGILGAFLKLARDLIGQSVVPEMLDDINEEFEKKLGVEGLLDILDTELQNAYDTFDDFLWRIFDEIIDPFVAVAIQTLQTIANKLAEIIAKAATAASAVAKSTGKGDMSKGEGDGEGTVEGAESANPTVVVQPVVVGTGAGQMTTNQYNLNMNTSAPSTGVQRAFRLMELMNT